MKGIPLGFVDAECSELSIYEDNGHLLTVAPPRSGKATDLLIPALLLCEHSCFVIDPRGQLAAVTARRRHEMGQEVVLLNPFQEWPDYLGRFAHKTFNPCCVLDRQSLSFATDCDGQSEALVLPEASGSHNKYFTDSARQLVSGLLMYIVRRFAPAERNLVSLYDIVTVPDNLEDVVKQAVALNDPLITGRLSRFAKSSSDERKSIAEIVLSAITELGFMGNKAIRDSLQSAPEGAPELRFKDLRRRPMTVYLILPLEQIIPCAKWFRLVLHAAMFDLTHDFSKPGPRLPVLMMLDEFAQLGRLEIIEAAEAQAAGFGIQLWPVLQDYGQLKGIYEDRADSFVAGAGISTWFAPREMTTAKYISDHSGTAEVGYETTNINQDLYRASLPGAPPGYGVNVGGGYERRERPLFRPDEVMKIGPEKLFVFYKGHFVLGWRRKYFDVPEFAGMYDPDPYHDKARARVDDDDDYDEEEDDGESEVSAQEITKAAEFHALRRERLWNAAHATFRKETGRDCDIKDSAQWERLSTIYDRLNGTALSYYCPACDLALSGVRVRMGFRCPQCGGRVEGPGRY